MQAQTDSIGLPPGSGGAVFVTTVADQPAGQLGPTDVRAWKPQLAARHDWEGHRATIKRLYIDDGRPLKEVIDLMRRDFGFEAT